jgi:protocatechuate 3,4-dioxygenase beta subunit
MKTLVLCLSFFIFLAAEVPLPLARAATCEPTPADALGPFYKPNAPERSRVGEGYVLSGVVRSSDCSVIAGARIEFWLAGPDGRYDDVHRATLISDSAGAYSFQSNFPLPYGRRPPHIHVRVSAPGYNALVTQHYPAEGSTQGTMDLVLLPAG